MQQSDTQHIQSYSPQKCSLKMASGYSAANRSARLSGQTTEIGYQRLFHGQRRPRPESGENRAIQLFTSGLPLVGDDWRSAIGLGPYTTCNREGSIHVGDIEDFLYDVIHGGAVAFQ